MFKKSYLEGEVDFDDSVFFEVLRKWGDILKKIFFKVLK